MSTYLHTNCRFIDCHQISPLWTIDVRWSTPRWWHVDNTVLGEQWFQQHFKRRSVKTLYLLNASRTRQRRGKRFFVKNQLSAVSARFSGLLACLSHADEINSVLSAIWTVNLKQFNQTTPFTSRSIIWLQQNGLPGLTGRRIMLFTAMIATPMLMTLRWPAMMRIAIPNPVNTKHLSFTSYWTRLKI